MSTFFVKNINGKAVLSGEDCYDLRFTDDEDLRKSISSNDCEFNSKGHICQTKESMARDFLSKTDYKVFKEIEKLLLEDSDNSKLSSLLKRREESRSFLRNERLKRRKKNEQM